MSKNNDASLELITIGRTSVDLYGDQIGCRLEDMSSFSKYLGGSPTNIAVGASRLGVRAAHITRVGDDALGRFVIETLIAEGVDASRVVTDPKFSTSTVVLGINDKDKCTLVYFRDHCADLAFAEGEIDRNFIASARATLISGTMFYNEKCTSAALSAIRFAKEAGRRMILDVDYRPVFLGIRDINASRFLAEIMRPTLSSFDLIVGTEDEIGVAAGVEGSEGALRQLRKLTNATIVLKRGEKGCLVFPGEIPENIEDGISGQGFDVEVCNVFGAGDAFMGGFLRGWLRDEPIESCITWGNACGAIVVSRHGCSPESPTFPELSAFLQNEDRPRNLSEDETLNHIHWATTRRNNHPEAKILAIDHQWQFEKWASDHGRGLRDICKFKSLLFSAAGKAAEGRVHLGLLVDDTYCGHFLPQIDPQRWFIARRTEVHNIRPLQFLKGPAISATLRTWPRHHVAKMLFQFHENDTNDMQEAQIQAAITLFQSARKTQHEVMIEPIPTLGKPVSSKTVAAILERLYAVGVKADWWKIDPPADVETWENLMRTTKDHDPYCRGFLLLGKDFSLEDLERAFLMGRDTGMCKGFAIGRPIFKHSAEAWFAGTMGDGQVVSEVSENYCRILDAWDRAGSQS